LSALQDTAAFKQAKKLQRVSRSEACNADRDGADAVPVYSMLVSVLSPERLLHQRFVFDVRKYSSNIKLCSVWLLDYCYSVLDADWTR
jgi:hypothetical protein